jgi:hypothetical protein
MPLSRTIAAALLTSAALAFMLLGCDRLEERKGERLAHNYCAACHAFPDPSLLSKSSWERGVLPQMAARVGVKPKSLFDETSRSPNMTVLGGSLSDGDWKSIVSYYRSHAPDSLAYQSPPEEPKLDPEFFTEGAFATDQKSSGVITLLKVDSARRRIFVSDAALRSLDVFDFNRRLVASATLESPATDLAVDGDHLLVLEVGILDPNDQARGKLVSYDLASGNSLRAGAVVLDSLLRPVFVTQHDFDGDGVSEFVVCEYGNNRGRLTLYKRSGAGYARQVLDASPGAIRVELRDLTGDGAVDLVALFGQGDERIALFENDGKGHFSKERILARFPPVYGSMYFEMDDFNGDGKPDILYVNGDNFDYSRILKPYHGVRILENDGDNNFTEKYFFPVYGAARAEVADFDSDGDLDVLVTSNFADFARHPERAIVFLQNAGNYSFRPFAFSVAARNQWNLTAVADLNGDGAPDILVGAMDLGNIARLQQSGRAAETPAPILVFENNMRVRSPATPRR